MNTLIAKLTCVALAVALTGPAWYEKNQPARLARLELTEEAMGSSFSLVLFGPDRPGLESAAAAAFAEAHRLDRLLSNYLADSEWSAINREAASRPVRVTPELFALLSECLDYSRMSDGAFDITVGPLIKVFQPSSPANQPPQRPRTSELIFRTVAEVNVPYDGSAFDFPRNCKGMNVVVG